MMSSNEMRPWFPIISSSMLCLLVIRPLTAFNFHISSMESGSYTSDSVYFFKEMNYGLASLMSPSICSNRFLGSFIYARLVPKSSWLFEFEYSNVSWGTTTGAPEAVETPFKPLFESAISLLLLTITIASRCKSSTLDVYYSFLTALTSFCWASS